MVRKMARVKCVLSVVKHKMDYGRMIDLLVNDTHFHNSIHVSIGVYKEYLLVSFEYYKSEVYYMFKINIEKDSN
jgi:hypothetical protein